MKANDVKKLLEPINKRVDAANVAHLRQCQTLTEDVDRLFAAHRRLHDAYCIHTHGPVQASEILAAKDGPGLCLGERVERLERHRIYRDKNDKTPGANWGAVVSFALGAGLGAIACWMAF